MTTRRKFMQSIAVAGAASALLPGMAVQASDSFAVPAEINDGKRKIIIDSDTATDDAVAILLALNAPDIKVEAITITVGNVGFEQQTKNALYTLEKAGKGGQVPVYQGSSRPLTREIHGSATYVHGTDGMSDSFFPEAKQKHETEHAVDAMIRLVEKYPGEITIVAIGPLTNIALALLRQPTIATQIKGIYFMGGVYKFYGNVTPVSSYNVWVDPEAARIVFQSGIPVTTVGFDVSVHSSVFTDADYLQVEKLNTKLSAFFMSINKIRRVYCKEHQKMNGSNHPDAITMAVFIDPSIGLEMLPRFVDIETQGELTRGAMLIDELGVYKKPVNATVCAQADEKKFKKMVFDTLKAV
jgi:purine nucleosidase